MNTPYEILNPVRLMRVEDFIKMSETLYPEAIGTNGGIEGGALNLMSRYEKLTSQPLERKHFVCEAQKPTDMYMGDQYYGAAMDAYNAAQLQLVFEGFKGTAKYYVENERIGIDFASDTEDKTVIDVFGVGTLETEIYLPKCAALYDFIYHIDCYNRTASQKIPMKFTEAFVKRIVG